MIHVLLKNEASVTSGKFTISGRVFDLNQIKAPCAQTIVQIVQGLLQNDRSGRSQASNKEVNALALQKVGIVTQAMVRGVARRFLSNPTQTIVERNL